MSVAYDVHVHQNGKITLKIGLRSADTTPQIDMSGVADGGGRLMAGEKDQVAHVWRRLGFGPTADDLKHGTTVGVAAVIDDLLARPLTHAADWGLPTGTDWTDEEPFLAAQIHNMAFSTNPVQERMAWVLQGLVVVGWDDVVQFADIQKHTRYLRTHALDSYRQILADEAVMAGMLKYLTGYLNTKYAPNQNFAREVMELFSLGQYHPITGKQNYTEKDVAQIARALTGWMFDWTDNHVFLDQHNRDHGDKTFLGKARGDAQVADVIAALAEQPSWKAFVPRRIWLELVGTVPSDDTLKALGTAYGGSGDLKALVGAIAHTPDFISDAAIYARVKSPIELIAAASRVLDISDLTSFQFGWELRDYFGQHPFWPPNVAGWPSGTRWMHAGHVLTWTEFAGRMVSASYGAKSGVVDELAKASKATAVSHAANIAGLASLTKHTKNALTAYVNFGAWSKERAAGLLQLTLLSPEFLAN